MKTNTEKAIEFLENAKTAYFCSRNIKKEYWNEIDEIIELLQEGEMFGMMKITPKDFYKREEHINKVKRGEKYEAIVKEMEEFLEPGVITEIPKGATSSRHIDIIKCTFNKIKQKYFPKPMKKTFTITIETKNEMIMSDMITMVKRLAMENGEIGLKEGD